MVRDERKSLRVQTHMPVCVCQSYRGSPAAAPLQKLIIKPSSFVNFLIIISLCCAVLAWRNEYWLHACFSNWITGEQAEPLKFPACSPASLAANWIEAERKAVCLGIMDNRDLSQSCYNDLLKDRRKWERKSLGQFQHQLLALLAFFPFSFTFFLFLSFVFLFLFNTFLLSLLFSLSFFLSFLFFFSLSPPLSPSWSCLALLNIERKSQRKTHNLNKCSKQKASFSNP